MASGTLTIDLAALAANWRALAAMGRSEAAAVLKADGYGLGAGPVARALWAAGARRFFVAVAEEGAALRQALAPEAEINILSGHMAGDTGLIRDHDLTPMLNSAAQVRRHLDALPGHGFGIQIDTGMHRLGMTPGEWAGLAPEVASKGARLVMSHLACADEAGHAQNPQQLATFRRLTDGIALPRSLAATGGILLGPEYHFDLTRPGIGLYGGQPFTDARPVVRLSLPVIQIRDVAPGDAVGYAATWRARRPARIATLAAGYADGLLRHMSNRAQLWYGDVACPLVGRVSMDLITADVTAVATDPEALDILCPAQSADALGVAAGTVGYEILTSLGPRYARSYTGGK